MPLHPVSPLKAQVSVSNKGKIDLKEPMPKNVTAPESTGNTPGMTITLGSGTGKSLGYKWAGE